MNLQDIFPSGPMKRWGMGPLVTLKMLMFCNATQQRAGMFNVNRGGAGVRCSGTQYTHDAIPEK